MQGTQPRHCVFVDQAEKMDHLRRSALEMFTKVDATGLAVNRILLGLVWLIDIVHERGLSRAHHLWATNPSSDSILCRFPLFASIGPLAFEQMCVVYVLMVAGVIGVMLGWHYRPSACLYCFTYWYLFILEKSRWNNHSYLFGLLSILMVVTDGHVQWSLDRWRGAKRESSVPRWHYVVFRFQIFLLYFYAGVKKIDHDWLAGYSMVNLSSTWIYTPFRALVADYYIDYYLIHVCGFLFDLLVGFCFLYPPIRPLAFVACSLFNLANSQMFSIGMFPFSMLAVMPIFCAPSWPTKLLGLKQKKIRQTSIDLDYRKCITLALLTLYALGQLVLPFAYLWLPGLNTWTKGMYGYNWDMMVHNWNHVHAQIRLVNRENGRVHYLDPEELSPTHRWYHHADMVAQFADCLRDQLGPKNETYSMYLDVWSSLNGRFVQRMYDPRVDMFKVKWSVWKRNQWVLPLISDRRRWRDRHGPRFPHLEPEARNGSFTVYISDFKGMSLDINFEPMFVDGESPSVHIMEGFLLVRHPPRVEYILHPGDTLPLPVSRSISLTPILNSTTSYALLYPRFINTKQHVFTWGQCRTRVASKKRTSIIEPWIDSISNLWLGIRYLASISLGCTLGCSLN